MPTGIPVATVAINGGANAGILAAKILATSDAALLERLKDYTKNLKEVFRRRMPDFRKSVIRIINSN